jgi:hypothetical protein
LALTSVTTGDTATFKGDEFIKIAPTISSNLAVVRENEKGVDHKSAAVVAFLSETNMSYVLVALVAIV